MKYSPKWIGDLLAWMLKLYIMLIGGALFLVGLFFIIYSRTDELEREPSSILFADLGFHLGTAGLIILLVEFGLRSATLSHIQHSIQSALDERLPPIVQTVHDSISQTLRDELRKTEATIIERIDGLRQVVTPNAVRDILEAALGSGEGNLQLADDLTVTINKLRELRSHTHWAKEIYIDYLSQVIGNARNNANALCKAAGEKYPSGEAQEVKLVSPAERSNFILSRLMSILEEGAEYRVLSDIQSWMDDSFNVFFSKNLEAVGKGVRIKRIFFVRHEQLLHGLDPDIVYSVLKQHLSATVDEHNGPTGYSVRLFDTSMHSNLLHGKKDDVDAEHYGIFIPAAGDFCLQFEVVRRHFSRVNLVNLSRAADELTEFTTVWDALREDLDIPALEASYSRWKALSQGKSG